MRASPACLGRILRNHGRLHRRGGRRGRPRHRRLGGGNAVTQVREPTGQSRERLGKAFGGRLRLRLYRQVEGAPDGLQIDRDRAQVLRVEDERDVKVIAVERAAFGRVGRVAVDRSLRLRVARTVPHRQREGIVCGFAVIACAALICTAVIAVSALAALAANSSLPAAGGPARIDISALLRSCTSPAARSAASAMSTTGKAGSGGTSLAAAGAAAAALSPGAAGTGRSRGLRRGRARRRRRRSLRTGRDQLLGQQLRRQRKHEFRLAAVDDVLDVTRELRGELR